MEIRAEKFTKLQYPGAKETKYVLFGDNDPRNDPRNKMKQTSVPKQESEHIAIAELLLILGGNKE